ncbi:MAG: hypothetical protein CFE32_17150 [Alphaproteobacteria bacterium PA3]|nr:MAG: hypothetical protein CFE32_17150 [Alphaproteobacteria bacterium PA3]
MRQPSFGLADLLSGLLVATNKRQRQFRARIFERWLHGGAMMDIAHVATDVNGPLSAPERAFRAIVYGAQFFFGGWFLYNGLNYFFEFFPQPPGSSALAYQLISALIDTGLFAVV